MQAFIIGFIVVYILTKAIMHPGFTLGVIALTIGFGLITAGGIACLLGNTMNGIPCICYGAILTVIVWVARRFLN